jgi:hypothetical protein
MSRWIVSSTARRRTVPNDRKGQPNGIGTGPLACAPLLTSIIAPTPRRPRPEDYACPSNLMQPKRRPTVAGRGSKWRYAGMARSGATVIGSNSPTLTIKVFSKGQGGRHRRRTRRPGARISIQTNGAAVGHERTVPGAGLSVEARAGEPCPGFRKRLPRQAHPAQLADWNSCCTTYRPTARPRAVPWRSELRKWKPTSTRAQSTSLTTS